MFSGSPYFPWRMREWRHRYRPFVPSQRSHKTTGAGASVSCGCAPLLLPVHNQLDPCTKPTHVYTSLKTTSQFPVVAPLYFFPDVIYSTPVQSLHMYTPTWKQPSWLWSSFPHACGHFWRWVFGFFAQLCPACVTNPTGSLLTRDRCLSGTMRRSLESSCTGACLRSPAMSELGFGTGGKGPTRTGTLLNSWKRTILQILPMPTLHRILRQSSSSPSNGQKYSTHQVQGRSIILISYY